MTLYKNKYRVESIRLKNWDYASNGYYFVTICTKNRVNFFGEIINDEMILSDIGKIAYQYWSEIPNHFPNVVIDEFIIMPNHVHGIIVINNDDVETCHGRSLHHPPNHGMSLHKPQTNQFSKPIKNSLSMIINQYKGSLKRYCNKNNIFFEWQPRFYENIVKDEISLNNIRNYIKNNPLNWDKDKNNENFVV